MRTCIVVGLVKLEQRTDLTFKLTYGQNTHPHSGERGDGHLTYHEAAAELGRCIMHQIALEGKLSNEGP
jgi:hypothetical protein